MDTLANKVIGTMGEPYQILTFKYRLLPNRRQHRALEHILEEQRQLYNAALEERIGCYKAAGRTITYVDQCSSLTEWRRNDETAGAVPLCLQRWTIKRVDEAYKAFFRRAAIRTGRAGFPRFRGRGWWKSFGFSEFSGVRFDGKRLRFAGIPGGLRVHLHRLMPTGKPVSCVFTRDGKGWHVSFQVRTTVSAHRERQTSIGIDIGLTSLATLSDGTSIPNPRHAKKAERELRRRQRALSRCKFGSARRAKVRSAVNRLHRKITAARDTYLHQVSADLVRRFDRIAVEKLNVKGLAAGRLAKSVHDASWGMLRQMLAYKAERAGIELIEVNPRNTSQACSCCGVIVPKTLSTRIHECMECGTVLDRDHNAAINILRLAVAGQGALNVAGYGERAPRNIISEN